MNNAHIIKGNVDVSNLDVSNTAKIRGKHIVTSVNNIIANALGQVNIDIGLPSDEHSVLKNNSNFDHANINGYYIVDVSDISSVNSFPKGMIGTGVLLVYGDTTKYQIYIDTENNSGIRSIQDDNWKVNTNTDVIYNELKKYATNERVDKIDSDISDIKQNYVKQKQVEQVLSDSTVNIPASKVLNDFTKTVFKYNSTFNGNLNDLTTSSTELSNYGSFIIDDETVCTPENNFPIDKIGMLLLYPNLHIGTQFYYPENEDVYFKRESSSTGWNEWVKFGIEYNNDPNIINELNKKIDKTEAIELFQPKGNYADKSSPDTQTFKSWVKSQTVIGSYSENGLNELSLISNNNDDSLIRRKSDAQLYDLIIPKKSGTISLVGDSYTKSDSDSKYTTETTNTNFKVPLTIASNSVGLTLKNTNADMALYINGRNEAGTQKWVLGNTSSSTDLYIHNNIGNSGLKITKDAIYPNNNTALYIKTSDYMAMDAHQDLSYSGFFRTNGKDDLPSLMIHITHPASTKREYARGIGFDYGHVSFNTYVTAFDKDGKYVGKRRVLIENDLQSLAKSEFFVSNASGNTQTQVLSPDKKTILVVSNSNNSFIWDNETKTTAIEFTTSGQILTTNSITAKSGLLQIKNGNKQWAMLFNQGGNPVLSYFDGSSWRGELAHPLAGGTIATREWSDGRYVRGDITNLGKKQTSLTTIQSGQWGKPIGYSVMVNSTSPQRPPNTGYGYWHVIGARDTQGGYCGIWGAYNGGQMYYGQSGVETENPSWYKIYTEAQKPTPDEIDAVNLGKGGNIRLHSYGSGKHGYSSWYENNARQAYVGYGADGTVEFSIANEKSNGTINLRAKDVQSNGSTIATEPWVISNFYKKSETYTRGEVDSRVNGRLTQATADGRYAYKGGSNTQNFGANIVDAVDVNIRSDINVKSNLVKINNSLQSIKSLTGYTYDLKLNDNTYKQSAGIIAQDVQKILPILVTEDSLGLLSVNYNGLTAILINAINELSERLERLERGRK